MAGAFGGGTIDTRTTTQQNTDTDEIRVDQGEGGSFGNEDSQTTVTETVPQESGAGTQVGQGEGGSFDDGIATTTIVQPTGTTDTTGIAVDQAQGGVFDGGGPTGTVASARGPAGAMGVMGIQGIQGIQGIPGPGGSAASNSWADYALGAFVSKATESNGSLTITINMNGTTVYRNIIRTPTYTDIIYSDAGLTTELTRR